MIPRRDPIAHHRITQAIIGSPEAHNSYRICVTRGSGLDDWDQFIRRVCLGGLSSGRYPDQCRRDSAGARGINGILTADAADALSFAGGVGPRSADVDNVAEVALDTVHGGSADAGVGDLPVMARSGRPAAGVALCMGTGRADKQECA